MTCVFNPPSLRCFLKKARSFTSMHWKVGKCWFSVFQMAMSHNGKYLWVPYYRRSFDLKASSPSALAIIDMQTDKVVRVMPTGPLPKYVAISPTPVRRW